MMRTKECGLWCSLCAEHMKNIGHLSVMEKMATSSNEGSLTIVG